MSKLVFLDRDGVLDVNKGYVHRLEDLEWIEGSREAVAYLCALGYTVVVATNQSGVARGYYTLQDVEAFHQQMDKDLAAQGGHIARYYVCPHYKEGSVPAYAVDCACRKPKPGLILAGLRDFQAATDEAFLIGDSKSDIEAATAAGIKGYLFTGGSLLTFVQKVLGGEMLDGVPEYPHH